MPLKGYRALGKARGERYLTPSGKEISKRQYRNIQLEREGVAKSLSEWENATQLWANRRKKDASPQFDLFQHRVSQAQKTRVMSEKEARKMIRGYTREGRREGWSRDPGGALARMLVDLGYRSEDADYNVGDTPRG